MKGISAVAIYLLFSFTFVSYFCYFYFFCIISYFDWIVIWDSDFKVVFDNKVVDLFSYKTYEGLSAGTGHSYFGDVDYTLTYSTENIPHDFASWVVGDSMEPELPDGDVVLIKQSANVEDRQIYAIEFNNQTYVKKVYRHKTYLRLVSINEKYDDIYAPYEEKPLIIGRVVGHFKSVEVRWF